MIESFYLPAEASLQYSLVGGYLALFFLSSPVLKKLRRLAKQKKRRDSLKRNKKNK